MNTCRYCGSTDAPLPVHEGTSWNSERPGVEVTFDCIRTRSLIGHECESCYESRTGLPVYDYPGKALDEEIEVAS